MKEINDIIFAYEKALENNQAMALATVVKVEGSSYRQPGARMLVTEKGELTGAISGGCLEGDALRKALLAIHQRQNKLITYDTTDEQNSEFRVQLGCNGIVHILFEYIDTQKSTHAISLLKTLQQTRKEAVIVTLFSQKHKSVQHGTMLIAASQLTVVPSMTCIDIQEFEQEISQAKTAKKSFLKELYVQEMEILALVEYKAPNVHLVIMGAGNDAFPMVETASILGWEITVIDGRVTRAVAERFPKAKRVILSDAKEINSLTSVDPFTVFVLMSHNYHYDLAALKSLIKTPTPYIGILGPKSKLKRMIDALPETAEKVNTLQEETIFGPMGLDIGAETAEEIALSVIAEIKAVLSSRNGKSLKFLPVKIHTDIPTLP